MDSLSCGTEADGATILWNPGGVATPPFCAEYNKVKTFLLLRRTPSIREALCYMPMVLGLHNSHQQYIVCLPKVCNDCRFLAIADEEGYVSILDTSSPCPASIQEDSPSASARLPKAFWLGHRNAIFNLAWTKVLARALGMQLTHTAAAMESTEYTIAHSRGPGRRAQAFQRPW